MSKTAATLIFLPLILAAALFAPSTALAVSFSGSGHGSEAPVDPFSSASGWKLSGTWSSNQFLGPSGSYSGTMKLTGSQAVCILPGCPVQGTNCYLVSGQLTFTGHFFLNPTPYSVTALIIAASVSPSGVFFSGVCRPPLPGNPRYIHMYFGGSATGELTGSSTEPTWTQPGGPAWIDDFGFNVASLN